MKSSKPIPDSKVPPENGSVEYGKLTESEKERSDYWWMEHDRCDSCLSVYNISHGSYENTRGGNFVCSNCLKDGRRNPFVEFVEETLLKS